MIPAKTGDDLFNYLGNTLSSIKKIKMSSEEGLPSEITVSNSLSVDVTSDSQVKAKNFSIVTREFDGDREIIKGSITTETSNIDVTANSKVSVKTPVIEVNVGAYNSSNNAGIYVKDNIASTVPAPTSSVTVGGTFAILPTTLTFTSENKVLTQSVDENDIKKSSVILLDSDNSIGYYTDENLTFVLEDPTKFVGQYLFLKLITDCKVTIVSKSDINGNSATIDGEKTITFNQKYQAVTLYSNGTEWFIM